MSSEVRRVPLDWEHPTRPDPYWTGAPKPRFDGRTMPLSRLREPGQRFVGLLSDYPDAVADWEKTKKSLETRTGHPWAHAVSWHLTGYADGCPCHLEPLVKHPCVKWAEDGETYELVTVTTEDELHAHLLAEHTGRAPDPAAYMPVFDGPADELGWCLYETTSEGTPSTPVFATPEELIEHLATVGKDYDQVPLRRTAAEALVRMGGSIGSAMTIGGQFYDSTRDADLIEVQR